MRMKKRAESEELLSGIPKGYVLKQLLLSFVGLTFAVTTIYIIMIFNKNASIFLHFSWFSCIRPLSAAVRAAFSGQTGPY